MFGWWALAAPQSLVSHNASGLPVELQLSLLNCEVTDETTAPLRWNDAPVEDESHGEWLRGQLQSLALHLISLAWIGGEWRVCNGGGAN